MANQMPQRKNGLPVLVSPWPAREPEVEQNIAATPTTQPIQTQTWNYTLTANAPMPIIARANVRRQVSITCAFGMAVARFSVSRADFPVGGTGWPRLPAAGQFLWTLEPGEGLWVQCDVNTDIGGCIKDVP